jgi:ABC-type multidrug transport system fused ATPase/permease subunit
MKARVSVAELSQGRPFIKDEALLPASGLFALNWRMFRSFPVFLALLPLTMATIVASSAAPLIYRWYSGQLSSGAAEYTLNGLILVVILATALRIGAWALFEVTGMWSSQRIHADMVRGMARTRTTFFDENPSGRLINRLVRDYDELRLNAIVFVGDFFNSLVEVLSVAVIAALANPWAAALMLPLLLIFSWVQWNRSAMIDHARSLTAIATGHMMGRKNDLIEGREIFLLYDRAGQLLQRMAQSFRTYLQASALTAQIEIWASFWVRVASESFSFGVLLLMTLAISQGSIGTTMAGVIISSLFGITGSVAWLDFATSLVSKSSPHVRRVFEFVDLPPEELEEGRLRSPVTSVPRVGEIEFVNYTMSYRVDTPTILNRLNLKLPEGSKTALIGRTGSGKTSLMQALMRMVYVHHGDIRIAGRSIFEMDVRELRKLFGVVPQSPYLFAGTIRSNLDRTGTIPTEILEHSMQSVGLPFSLQDTVHEGGHNFSVGERQLNCLARVIAAGRGIVLMDEPTSGLDPETDARISEILRTTLKDKTVLTIAHRQESLGHYDRIVEMKNGRIEALLKI